jgi:CHAT domain-containing protein
MDRKHGSGFNHEERGPRRDWRVGDEDTAGMMVDFYFRLMAGQPAAEALRSVQLRMIEAGEPPRLWAPFILIGR